ncbi:helix-turn-helix domain-containing protein [Serratia marcescens]|uniref:helix-turn-helix domain-containing protein n=1 Tax=Serratia marcescens TaxID=615 RepID=UPI0013DABCC0|nr:helix-turn-helix transcriptional regulator [Serratia marcescens]
MREKNKSRKNGILITNDNFVVVFFKNKIQGRVHDKIDVINNLDNIFISINTTYYVDNRVLQDTGSYAKLLEMEFFSGNSVCLMNFKGMKFNANCIDMHVEVSELINLIEKGDYTEIFSPHKQLTRQEIKILKLVSSGMSSGLLAKALNLSVKTIHSHKNSAVKKLGFKNFNTFISSSCQYGYPIMQGRGGIKI